ncbi:MAG: STAS domain-containing protein, partial [Candidatus Scalindua sp.]
MKITSRQTHNPPARLPVRTALTGGRCSGGNIEIIDVIGELTGNGALELQEYFSRYSGKGKHYLVINLKHVNEIDGMGISVLEQLMKIGIHVRLLNVSRHIRAVLSMARKEDVFVIYNETDCDKAVSLFESEIREEKAMRKSG